MTRETLLPIGELNNDDLGEIIDLLNKHHGYDFSGYAKSSLKRRITRYMNKKDIRSVFELKFFLINESGGLIDFLQNITVNVTEMFRDPSFFNTLRTDIFPILATYPFIKIWHAGCSTGEEVYSLAILLKEAGLLERSQIYATDINASVLEKAHQGVFPMRLMREFTQNYLKAGGKADFSHYYTARYDNVIFDKELKRSMTFSFHNLVSDASFNEFNLILCRNVLIYFDPRLQNRAIKLFTESLCTFGYLALGTKESLLFTEDVKKYQTISNAEKIYRRTY